MRRGAITFVVVMGLVCAAVPALAVEDATITASNFRFDPREVTIAAGETVTFANAGGIHNFSFDDGPQLPPEPADPTDSAWDAPPRRTFDQAGQYAFLCEAHPTTMTGVITVQPPGSPPPTPTPTPTPPPDPPSGDAPVEVRTLRTDGNRFCTKRSRRCRRPGVRVRIDLSQATPVSGTLARRPPRGAAQPRRFGRVNLGTVPAGPRTLRFTRTTSGRRLTAGRYALALEVGDAARRTLRFRVR